MKTVDTIPTEVDYRKLMHKRVAIYCRVSTKHAEQSGSLEAQIEYFKNIIAEHDGWWTLAGVYADRATGRNTRKRTALREMIEDCRNGKIDLIVMKSVSRLGRDTVMVLTFAEEMLSLGVDVYFDTNKLYLHDPNARFILTIYSSIAQEESMGVSENIKWGIRHSFERTDNKYLSRPCYGYRRGQNSSLVIDPHEASVVALIFALRSEGQSLGAISKKLSEMGVAAPHGGVKWGRETVRYLLSNEKYKGEVMLQKTFVADFLKGRQVINRGEMKRYIVIRTHKAIISAKRFDDAHQGEQATEK